MSKILPSNAAPPIRAFTFWSYYLGIIKGRGYDLSGILYNRFFTLYYAVKYNRLGYVGDFNIKKMFITEPFSMPLDYPIDFIQEAIQNDKYAVVVLNAKHLSSVAFDREWYHDWLIFGFDDELKEFSAIGYVVDTKCHAFEYKIVQISYDDFVAALPPENAKTGYEDSKMNNHFCSLPDDFIAESVNLKKLKHRAFLYAYNIIPLTYNARIYRKFASKFRKEYEGKHIRTAQRKQVKNTKGRFS